MVDRGQVRWSEELASGADRLEVGRRWRHGIHAGLDVACSDDDSAIYVQFGSAWARP